MFSVRVMHGGTRPEDRQQIMDDFREGRFEILLVSEVGSEGLDFEFCNAMVNYDLPWNPMRVEQRIGRIDRFGQQHEKIFIFNMHIPGTIETDILERLYWRIGLFESSIGDLEPILREELEELNTRLLNPSLTHAQREREADRFTLAIEQRKNQLQQLEESRGVLATVDQLEIDGMTDQGPSNGRYVGKAELIGLVEYALTLHGGELSVGSPDETYLLRGTPELLRAMNSAGLRSRRRRDMNRQRLAIALRDGSQVAVTFDSESASKRDLDLVTSSHDLVRTAIEALEKEELDLAKWGSVIVPGLPHGGPYLVSVDLIESNGLRTRRELWASGIDLSTGEPRLDLDNPFFTALAEGSLADLRDQISSPDDVEYWYDMLQGVIADRLEAASRQREAENAALVQSRLESQLKAVSIKREHAERTLHDMQSRNVHERVTRMWLGKLSGLDRKEEDEVARADKARQCSTWRQPVAVLLCAPAPHHQS